MGKTFAAVVALEWLFTAVNAKVLLEVMLKLEGFLAMGTLKLTKHGTLIMADHVSLESVDVGERFAAHLARL